MPPAARPGEPTGCYTAVLADDGSLVVGVADMAATDGLTADDVPTAALADSCWLVLDGNLPAPLLADLLARAAARGLPVALDPVGAAKAARLGSLRGVHTFTPTSDELLAWSGEADETAAVARAHADGVEVLWLRRGRAGSRVCTSDGHTVDVPALDVAAVDVTGAGDAMLAAYLHALLAGADAVQAARFGTAAAALTVTVPGAVHPDLSAALVRPGMICEMQHTEEVRVALAEGRPVVALESTIISHGMPYPDNVAMAREVEQIVRDDGAAPATIAVLDGVPRIGLDDASLELLGSRQQEIRKVSLRDLPHVLARGEHGATTVAARCGWPPWPASGSSSPAASAASTAARPRPTTRARTWPSSPRTPVTVVSAGVKTSSTSGSPSNGWRPWGCRWSATGTDAFPAFFSRDSAGSRSPMRVDSPDEIAAMMHASDELRLGRRRLRGEPGPRRGRAPADRIDAAIDQALADATPGSASPARTSRRTCWAGSSSSPTATRCAPTSPWCAATPTWVPRSLAAFTDTGAGPRGATLTPFRQAEVKSAENRSFRPLTA